MQQQLRRKARRAMGRAAETRARQRTRAYVREAARQGLVMDLHPSVVLGERLVIDARGDEPSRLTMAEGSYMEDDCLLRLKGGTIDFAPNAFIRRWTVLNVQGRLELGRESGISWGGAIHAAEHVRIGRWAGTSERVTITDSRHLLEDPDVWFYHQSESAPTVLGENTWVAANSVVGMGVTIGDRVIVAANSTVLKDIPDDVVVAGSPARVIGPSRRGGPGSAPS